MSQALHILCVRWPCLGRESWCCLTTNCWKHGESELVLVLLAHKQPPRYAYVFEVPEGHELDNVSKDRLSFGRPQNPIIAIQHLHVTEVSIAHAHDDDRHGEVGGVDYGLPGVGHVCDDAVGQDQQDEVLLR